VKKLTNTAAHHVMIWFIDCTMQLKNRCRGSRGWHFSGAAVVFWFGGTVFLFWVMVCFFNYQSVFFPGEKDRGKHHSL